MSYLDLDAGEVVRLQDENIRDPDNDRLCSITLTNRNIIIIRHDRSGGELGPYKFPLESLKEDSGKPNVLVSKDKGLRAKMSLFYEDAEGYYLFPTALSANKWEAAITKAYKARMAELKREENPRHHAREIADSFRETLNSAKDGITAKMPKKIIVKEDLKCPACGAPIKGEKGQTVRCSYCCTEFIIK